MSFEEHILDKRYIIVGGKGGVGKTTIASTIATHIAGRLDEDILLMSTDPAHSLSDSLDVKDKGKNFYSLEEFDNLYVLELDPSKEIKRIMEKFGQVESPLPYIDLMMGNMPGVDELFSFQIVLENILREEFSRMVIDTAPTGHTLRLLSLPEVMESWVGRMLKVHLTLSKWFASFKSLIGLGEDRAYDMVLNFLKEMRETVERAREKLTCERETTFIVVTIPEEMAIEETNRLLIALENYGIPVKYIVVNMIYRGFEGCPFCKARRKVHTKNLERIYKVFSDEYEIVEVPLMPYEVRGLKALSNIAGVLFGGGHMAN
ncbi:hypothetical protein DRO02_05535 [archaeon]|nr:MAG: hypothetical protein DRO02_05535 [archaeon]RLG65962.1 MAG: hypothetical protein DRO21_00805 [archaeon]HDM24305.1 hypothetical protein [Candidatus Bathyarchaeota archaeon]